MPVRLDLYGQARRCENKSATLLPMGGGVAKAWWRMTSDSDQRDLIPYLKDRLKLHGRADTWVSTRLTCNEVKEIVRLLEEVVLLRERVRVARECCARPPGVCF